MADGGHRGSRRGRGRDDASPLKVERIPQWCEDAERGLSRVLEPYREDVIADVRSGHAELYRVNDGESWLVARIDGDELVVMCYQGRGAREIMQRMFAAARRADCETVRFHTPYEALGRMMRPLGFELAERVYRARVPR